MKAARAKVNAAQIAAALQENDLSDTRLSDIRRPSHSSPKPYTAHPSAGGTSSKSPIPLSPVLGLLTIQDTKSLPKCRQIHARASQITLTNAPAAKPQSTPHVCLLISSRSARSEEHTSELQSLMRISYAVYCLKKKTTS